MRLLIPTGIVLTALAGCDQAKRITSDRPNVIIILADDLGYGSVNAYGAPDSLLRTPNIDRLAKEGMLFTDASTPSSVCSPTRYGLLMGRYPWRTSLQYGNIGINEPLLPDPERTSLADIFKQNDYQTAAIGKWHLGYGDTEPVDYTKKLSPGPLDLGFDYHFGLPGNHGDVSGIFIENNQVYGLRSQELKPGAISSFSKEFMGIDAPQRVDHEVMEFLTSKAVDWIKSTDRDSSFFLYFTPVAVHKPITPSRSMVGSSNCGLYGDFIQDLDRSVGMIVQALEDEGISENTLVIFTSDNGAAIPGRNKKTAGAEAIRAGLKVNGDLRGEKHTIWEGGTRVPFIVKWPGKVEAGTKSSAMINLVDIFGTMKVLLNGDFSMDENSWPDSYSFFNVLMNPNGESNRWEMVTMDARGAKAIRIAGWKYIDDALPEDLPQKRNKNLGVYEKQLYYIYDDPYEVNNLIEKHPDQVSRLLPVFNQLTGSINTE